MLAQANFLQQKKEDWQQMLAQGESSTPENKISNQKSDLVVLGDLVCDTVLQPKSRRFFKEF